MQGCVNAVPWRSFVRPAWTAATMRARPYPSPYSRLLENGRQTDTTSGGAWSATRARPSHSALDRPALPLRPRLSPQQHRSSPRQHVIGARSAVDFAGKYCSQHDASDDANRSGNRSPHGSAIRRTQDGIGLPMLQAGEAATMRQTNRTGETFQNLEARRARLQALWRMTPTQR